MLINWDSNMSENCGECGIALSIRPYTGINVASSVCGLSLSYRKVLFFVFLSFGFLHSVWNHIHC